MNFRRPVVYIFWLILLAFSTPEVLARLGPGAPKRAGPQCFKVQPMLSQGSLSCVENVEQIKKFSSDCVDLQLAGVRFPKEGALALHAYYNLIFDRELMLIYRFKPVKKFDSMWKAFEKKWRDRFTRHAEVLAVDQSPLLVEASRGSLQMRLDWLGQKKSEADQLDRAYAQIVGQARGPGLYALTADIMLLALDSEAARKEFLRNANGDESKAAQMIEEEKDKLLIMFPELESHPGAFSNGLIRYRYLPREVFDTEKFGAALMARGEAGRFRSMEERYDSFAKYVSDMFHDTPGDHEFLLAMDDLFRWLTEDLQRNLDESLDAATEDPKGLLNSSFVIGVTLSELGESDFLLKQNLIAYQCTRIYSDARWQYYNDLQVKYRGVFILGTTVVMLFGGAEAIIGWAGVRLLGARLVGRAIFSGLTRMGGKLINMSAIGMTTVGVPSSGFALVEYYREYHQMAKIFYENPNFDTGVRASAVKNGRELISGEVISLMIYLTPLLF